MDWAGAHASLASAYRARPLEAVDLELVATAAYMLGRDEEYLQFLELAHRLHLEEGRTLPAVRCAFWVGANLAQWGEIGHATGWLGRAQRLLEREEGEHVEHGYLLLPVVLRCAAGGDYAAAAEAGAQAAAVGERFADPDLFALAVQEQGKIMVRLGRVDEGLSLLDEAMVAATAGELSPIVTGLVYCSVIAGCQEVYDLRRAQEWTAALTRWCDQQPDLLAFTGQCLVHRAEILQLRGAWQEALREARRARERLPGRKPATTTSADALYRQGEVLRQLGRFGEAEDAYRQASRAGCEPLPGLALLRMAQGDADAAAAAIRRVVAETTAPVRRAPSSRRSHRGIRARCSRRLWRTPMGWSSWPTASRVRRSLRSGRGRAAGRTSTRPTRQPVPASRWRSPAAPWETTTPRRWSSRRPTPRSGPWGRRRTRTVLPR